MRAAIYARFSSEQQNERSIDDQVRLCRERAALIGADVVDLYCDYAISGAHLLSRPQALRLLEDARARRFDVVIAEGLDRLSRDQEDIAAIFKRLGFAGVKIVTVGEGEISELHVGLKGTMNALFLKDLALKVRRGQVGRVLKGFAAGGCAYGYAVVRAIGDDGEPRRGLRRIDEAQAAIIRRVFRAYVRGESPRAIAKALNAEGVPSPAGGHWNASTINGHPQRGNGILYNRLYRGELIYNRIAMVKNPETGRRISRPNDPQTWIITAAPELRIVDEDLWQAAQALKRGSRATGVPNLRQQRPRHLLSGLARCGCCGGAYAVKAADRLGCSRRKEAGICDNGRIIRVAELERRVLDGLRTKLLSPAALRIALIAYREERARLAGTATARRRDLARRQTSLEREIGHVVEAIAAGGMGPALAAKLRRLETEREAAAVETARLAAAHRIVDLHPQAIDAYTAAVEALQQRLATPGAYPAEAIAIVRGLIDHVELRPAGDGAPLAILLHGRLGELLDLAQRRPGEVLRTVSMVAEDRLRRDSSPGGARLVIAC